MDPINLDTGESSTTGTVMHTSIHEQTTDMNRAMYPSSPAEEQCKDTHTHVRRGHSLIVPAVK